jgi:hypothetical protein
MDRHSIKSKTDYRQALEEKPQCRKVNEQTKMKRGVKNVITKNYIIQNIKITKRYY